MKKYIGNKNPIARLHAVDKTLLGMPSCCRQLQNDPKNQAPTLDRMGQ